MTSDYIYEKAKKLLRQCGTRNPFKIADEINVHVLWWDFADLKGMYKVIDRSRFIFINNNIDEYEQRVVCAHELGHDALHREFAKTGAFSEFMLYDMKTRPEYEANVFASEILLDDKEILELAEYGYDEQQIASEICVNINLLLVKLNEMNKRGYKFNLSRVPRGDFLRF
jgi:Zn-dependent peptidase ImmA (M78 family)